MDKLIWTNISPVGGKSEDSASFGFPLCIGAILHWGHFALGPFCIGAIAHRSSFISEALRYQHITMVSRAKVGTLGTSNITL
ncbi:MAG: hypothetical protein F6K09_21545 [Merismopedia sp. SIO2A8]|nr:hypothetical protein [Merismopedia sp. SIO2A8]